MTARKLALEATAERFIEPLIHVELDRWHQLLDDDDQYDEDFDIPTRAEIRRRLLTREGLRDAVRSDLETIERQIRELDTVRLRRIRSSNRTLMDVPDYAGTENIESILQVLDLFIADASNRVPDRSMQVADFEGEAALGILHSAHTTLSAIGLLLAAGYSSDAFARWRGLHELASTAVLLARTDDGVEAATRFVCHGGLLPRNHVAYRQSWATEGSFTRDYEWLRAVTDISGGIPHRISQRWLFDTADLRTADFAPWVHVSHARVHLSSTAVAWNSKQAGAAPAGWDSILAGDVELLAACSLLELVMASAYLLIDDASDAPRLYAWAAALHDHVEEVFGPILEEIRWGEEDWRPSPMHPGNE